jgi:hypothetical protein
LNGGRRTGNVATRASRSEVALMGRREIHAIAYFSAVQGRFGDVKAAAIDSLPVHKVVTRCDCYGTRVVGICVIKIIRTIVDDVGIPNERVVEIYIAVVPAAGVVPRMKRFTRTKRKPTDSPTKTSAESKTGAPMRTTDETDKCRTINRTRIIWTRAPSPAAAYVSPTAIMEWSESPRRVVDPSPAPGSNVAPIAVAVRRPSYVYRRWIPDRTIIRFFIPSAVVIEVAVPWNIA